MERVFVLVLFVSLSTLVFHWFGPSAQERLILRRAGAVRPHKQDPLALEDEELSVPFGQRVLGPIVDALRDQVLKYTPVGMRRQAEERLLRAGRPMEVGALFSIRLMSLGIGLAVGGLFWFLFAEHTMIWRLLVSAGCVGLAWFAPVIWLNGAIARRKAAVRMVLPDVLDLLCVSVEAGLGFDAGIQKVAEKFKGPLAEELQEYIKEIRLGRSRTAGLRGLARRTDVDELRSFVAALIQAEQMGVSLAQVLRIQSDQMRHQRRLLAQERGMKVPVKMLFPLVFFILPTIFIVLFAPLAVHLMETLGGKF